MAAGGGGSSRTFGPCLRSAARAAIVMPAVFAFADKVIGDPQTATFAAYGSFAMLVLVDFTGPMRSRLVAYLGLAGAGAANVVLGTFCSRNAWLAAAATSALLTFILPVTLPVPFSEVPARLEGWGLAAAAGILAQMLLWPARPSAGFQRQAARACDALAQLAEAEGERDRSAIPSRRREAQNAVKGLLRSF